MTHELLWETIYNGLIYTHIIYDNILLSEIYQSNKSEIVDELVHTLESFPYVQIFLVENFFVFIIKCN